MIRFNKLWSVLLNITMGDEKYWARKHKIPIGTLKPYELYEGFIPDEDIVTISFDPVNISGAGSQRNAFNILILGGSGDGKSLIMKQIWSVLHQAGYYNLYIDPKSTESGRARIPYKGSPRIAPNMFPKGIKLQHFIPHWASKLEEHLIHNFRTYTTSLNKIDEREMWQGLGMTNIGATWTAMTIDKLKNKHKKILVKHIRNELLKTDKDELPSGTFDNVNRVLTDVEYFNVVSDDAPELKLWNEMKKGYSVCISYNSGSPKMMTFDIGKRIKEIDEMYKQGNRIPTMVYLDDASFFAKEMKLVPFNFAVQEIKHIGFNYRSKGIFNTLAVQSLGIIDENVAESYPIKIISPLFQSVDSLSSIGIPRKAIDYLKSNELVSDKKRYLQQFLLIDANKDVIPFFPFTPPCNHFTEIYFPKGEINNE